MFKMKNTKNLNIKYLCLLLPFLVLSYNYVTHNYASSHKYDYVKNIDKLKDKSTYVFILAPQELSSGKIKVLQEHSALEYIIGTDKYKPTNYKNDFEEEFFIKLSLCSPKYDYCEFEIQYSEFDIDYIVWITNLRLMIANPNYSISVKVILKEKQFYITFRLEDRYIK